MQAYLEVARKTYQRLLAERGRPSIGMAAKLPLVVAAAPFTYEAGMRVAVSDQTGQYDGTVSQANQGVVWVVPDGGTAGLAVHVSHVQPLEKGPS